MSLSLFYTNISRQMHIHTQAAVSHGTLPWPRSFSFPLCCVCVCVHREGRTEAPGRRQTGAGHMGTAILIQLLKHLFASLLLAAQVICIYMFYLYLCVQMQYMLSLWRNWLLIKYFIQTSQTPPCSSVDIF